MSGHVLSAIPSHALKTLVKVKLAEYMRRSQPMHTTKKKSQVAILVFDLYNESCFCISKCYRYADCIITY